MSVRESRIRPALSLFFLCRDRKRIAAAQQQPAAGQPAAEPVNIEGMTPDQVEVAMGKPEKKVTLGSKVIYYYKDMKVIFLSGNSRMCSRDKTRKIRATSGRDAGSSRQVPSFRVNGV